jgi:CopG antitoxin of type II toxin-antitoxin system
VRQESMPENRTNRDPIPDHFNAADDLDDFWSTHSTADYDDLFSDVEFAIKLEDELIPIPPALALQLRERAQSQGVSVETLVTNILREKMQEAA